MFSNRTSDPASFPLMESISYYYISDEAKYDCRYTVMLVTFYPFHEFL
jgi:hypothetical protein